MAEQLEDEIEITPEMVGAAIAAFEGEAAPESREELAGVIRVALSAALKAARQAG